ncbi:hypothetical protein [Nocardioides taihuensis]|uniref:GH16 domain-containing protein n=1 Tax=Nocardioides taihuensis TaxID=1835606 RepID=A0ABW0BEP6_9ACTN
MRTRPRTSRALPAFALALAAATMVTVSAHPAQPASAMEPRPSPVVSARTSASLSISPKNYIGGQLLTWSGNVGHRGERRVGLQLNMNLNGWVDVDGVHARTRADGSFSFGFRAPSMFGIRYRAKAGPYVTPDIVFNAKTQDLTVRRTGLEENRTNDAVRVDVGETYGLTVDTAPDNIFRSPQSAGAPVLVGRELTLQERTGPTTWHTVDTTTVGLQGFGFFTGLSEDAGTTVYRVRAENYFTDGNRIGWTQSFPLYVLAGRAAQDAYAAAHEADDPRAREVDAPSASRGGQPPTASQNFEWYPSYYDFGWATGESLDSPPGRGTRIKGHWVDYSSGSGRVAKYNGGLAIESKRYAGAGPGDFGTTSATLQGNAVTYGRWEVAMRIRNAFETGGRPYRVLAELIPARPSDYDCGAHNITVASISPFSQRVGIGVRSPRQVWRGAARDDFTPLVGPINAAVEVSRRHLTWFLDGAPVASVTRPAAIPRVPLTLRLSLRGDGQLEMNQTALISDWQRGFPISTGQQRVAARKLSGSSANAGC